MSEYNKKKSLLLYIAPAGAAYQMEKESEYNFQLRPKLGLLYLASTLKKRKNITCEIWDQTVSYFNITDIRNAIDSGDYLFAGFYAAISMNAPVIDCIKKIREACKIKIPIIVGGPSFPIAEEFLKAGCDIVCNGEGEDVICDIAEFLSGNGSLEGIQGISYMRGGQMIQNKRRPLISNIDEIPFPCRTSTDINRYHDFYIFTMRKPYTTMIASRGCPFNCSFCECPNIWERQYRLRSVDNVLAEMDELIRRHSVRYIAFQDDVFGMNYDWTEEFCVRLKNQKYDVRWMCILHPFSFKKDRFRMLKMLREAGCDTISTGLQSAHSEILKRLNRSTEEPEGIREIVKFSRRLDMLSLVSFIFGSPGETRQTIKTSVDFAFKVKPNYARFYNMVILPGSEIAKRYGQKGKLCDFTDYELERFCRVANRNFFLSSDILVRNFLFVLRHNPVWFSVAAKYAFHLLDVIGIGKMKSEKNDSHLVCKPGV